MTGEFDLERGAIDFLVTYPPDYDFGPWAGRLLELEERLTALFDRRVDLVIAREFRNPFLARSIEQTRKLVYAA